MPATTPSVIVIGAGFGGLGMAMELQRNGFGAFTILERADDLGGVWRENTYPGAACDVPSPLYSFSYEPKPDWPHRYSGRRDIQDYLHAIAVKHRLLERIRFGVEVTEAGYDESAGRWTVRTAGGRTYTADVVVSAVGQLSRPRMPDIPGRESFAGPSFHSAQWDHSVDLAGKRVAVIGTGASAIQFVPAIQPEVARLTLFQRTAAWVVRRTDREYRPVHHILFRYVPGLRLAQRLWVWCFLEFFALGLATVPPIRRIATWLGLRALRHDVPDAGLRAKLTPDYPVLCKRVLFSNEYYPALTRPNVDVVTTGIAEIVPEGVRTTDGEVHPADVLVYGTGFKGTEFLWPIRIFGRDGAELERVWSGGARAYLGMAVPGFPNLFLMYGPNTNLGIGSIVYMIECQARYIRHALDYLAAHPGRRLEVRPDTARKFDERTQRRLRRTPWVDCTSWYRTQAGRITNNWPGTVTAYRLRTRRLHPEDYELTGAA
ncbi:cation diffusion facilitator CzcD-associated flavoprotein CzcO [Nocardia transvalensis]|uniref:Cation diffusion facilitator CzcD-associated flavoprotein CzcO n=1 Tax=Nocardia transvalensis TaxID=37333 RepID=A0A7W9UH68_9NOCA|nr:NAD(P)/FAD-dependent oxidoreductase [Nocardia transvalensis]MBB5913039.1 cation diffusion facilitator CzcD-associated flavoprotein CzcO [Nocardia transvalensis]